MCSKDFFKTFFLIDFFSMQKRQLKENTLIFYGECYKGTSSLPSKLPILKTSKVVYADIDSRFVTLQPPKKPNEKS